MNGLSRLIYNTIYFKKKQTPHVDVSKTPYHFAEIQLFS